MKTVFFVASTGGHLRELLGLSYIFDKYDYHIFTEKTNSTRSLKGEYKQRIHYFVFGSKIKLIPYLFKFSYNCILSLFFYLKYRPDYVVTTGTHTAVPLCFIAHFFRKKIIYIETRASFHDITQTGKIVKSITDLFIIQRKSLEGIIPNAVLCEVEE